MDDLKKKGVTFKSEMIHSPVCRMAVCLDAEGNSLHLLQLKPKFRTFKNSIVQYQWVTCHFEF